MDDAKAIRAAIGEYFDDGGEALPMGLLGRRAGGMPVVVKLSPYFVTSWMTMCEAMKPAPPVTRIFFGVYTFFGVSVFCFLDIAAGDSDKGRRRPRGVAKSRVPKSIST